MASTKKTEPKSKAKLKAPAKASLKTNKSAKAPKAPEGVKPEALIEPKPEIKTEGYGEVFEAIVRDFDLSEREARFVMEMAVDENASAAYVRAGYSPNQANANAARLNAKDSVQSALAFVRKKVAEKTGFSAEDCLQLAADILQADTRELVEYKVGCCRYCYGDQHLFQRTAGEMAMDRAKHEAQVQRRKERNKDYEDPGFDEMGGEGYDIKRPPNTDCPKCGGDGAGRVVIKDTRDVSKAAAALYAGVKQNKDGIEVKFHDKSVMLDKMFRYHGLYEVDNKQKAAAAADPAALIALSEAMEKSREQRRAIMEHRKQMGFTGD